MNATHVYERFRAASEIKHSERWSTRALAALRLWIQRSRGRESLREPDERLLHDIGVRYEEALLEAHKPFWKA